MEISDKTINVSEKIKNPNLWIPAYMAMAGFLLNFIAYYPGFMSPDTVDQYGQSVTRHFNDWHPPVMSWFWSLLNQIHSGPLVMLAFQLGLLWTSFYLMATSLASSKRNRLWLFIIILLAPFIQNFSGYIIKDAQMALAWLCSFSLVVRAEYHKRPMSKAESILSLLLLMYGTLTRINAIPGALPLFYFWIGNVFQWKKKGYALASTLLSVLLLLGASALLSFYLKPEKKYPQYKLYLHDLTGIYTQTGKNYFPPFIQKHPGFDTGYLKSNYTTATFDHLWWNEENRISFPSIKDSTISIVQKAWKRSILENPGVYSANRWDGFLHYLRLKKRTWFVTLHADISSNPYGFTFKRNPVSQVFLKWIKINSRLPWMRPWFWLALNLILFIAVRALNNFTVRRGVSILLLSSLLYLLPQFFVFQVDTDFRYFYWNCLSITVAGYFLMLYKRQKEKKRLSGKKQPFQ